MKQSSGKCVFCGKSGLTKGHVWPEWFGNVLPLDAPNHTQITGEIRTFTPIAARPRRSEKIRQGHAGSRKPRNTCGDCNGGWMSRLENAAIPFMTPVMLGQACIVAPFAQRFIAALLCLITIRVEFLHRSTQAVPVEDRVWLMNKFEPPPNWKIWLARYGGDRAHEHWCRHHGIEIASSLDERDGPYTCNTQVTTLVLGKLCAHIFSSTVWDDFAGYEGVHLTPIWPPSNLHIDWRRVTPLFDQGVLTLSEALVRETPSIPGLEL
jgi:hypothetical protein